MRVTYGSVTFADTTTVVQLDTAAGAAIRAMAVTAKARVGNAGFVYLGSDTNVATTKGMEMDAGDREEMSFEPGSVNASNFYAIATSSGDVLDWIMVVEN